MPELAGGLARRRSRLREALPLLAVFVILATALIARALFNAGTVPLLADTDDAMRLVTVRDLLGGQAWTDIVQHRLNTPFGAEIHWSRLIDWPITALLLLFRPFAGAETLVFYVWPLLQLLGLLALSGTIATRLAGPEGQLPGLVLPAFSPALMAEFSPGRLDHHGAQILLVLVMLLGALEALRRPHFAALAGLAAATSLAIGIEGLPSVIATTGAFALAFVRRGDRGPALQLFGISFAAASVVHLLLASAPERWFVPACDALSIVFVVAAIGLGALAALLPPLLARTRSPVVRATVLGAAALALGAGLLLLFPECRLGPYAALDPWLIANWLDRIVEAKPAWTSFASMPAYVVAVAVPPALAVCILGATLVRNREARDEWLVYGAFLVLAVLVMLLQLRGARLAAPLAIPAGAAFIVWARTRYLAGNRLRYLMALLGGWLGFAGIVLGVAVNLTVAQFEDSGLAVVATAQGEKQLCLMPAAFETLAALPPGRVMGFIDLGSHLLAFTPHSVVAAPYHRNIAGVRDTFDFFNGPIAAARDILVRRGVNYVVICPAMPEMRGLADAAPDAFVRLHALGALPSWLEEISPPGAPLTLYRVHL
ncbi:MAG: Oligosaccharyl transferase [Devosia sp.]|nr:Oligosaccharyl transferase [Devosia sp.]